jgi:hypothetical protein
MQVKVTLATKDYELAGTPGALTSSVAAAGSPPDTRQPAHILRADLVQQARLPAQSRRSERGSGQRMPCVVLAVAVRPDAVLPRLPPVDGRQACTHVGRSECHWVLNGRSRNECPVYATHRGLKSPTRSSKGNSWHGRDSCNHAPRQWTVRAACQSLAAQTTKACGMLATSACNKCTTHTYPQGMELQRCCSTDTTSQKALRTYTAVDNIDQVPVLYETHARSQFSTS